MFEAIFWPSYGIVGVLIARFVYGRLRAMAIQDCGLDWSDDLDAVWVVGLGSFFSFPLWPLALVLAVIFCNPPKTNEELRAEKEALAKELERMERAAGIIPGNRRDR